MSNLSVFQKQLDSFPKNKRYQIWKIGTPVVSCLLNFFKRLRYFEVEDFEAARSINLHMNKKYIDSEIMFCLQDTNGKSWTPNNFQHNEQTYFKLGAMRQYIEVLLMFGILEVKNDINELKGNDLLEKDLTFCISYDCCLLMKRDLLFDDFNRFVLDQLKTKARLKNAWACKLSFTILICFMGFLVDANDSQTDSFNVYKQSSMDVYSINDIADIAKKNGLTDFFKYLQDSNFTDAENTYRFIREILPYEQED